MKHPKKYFFLTTLLTVINLADRAPAAITEYPPDKPVYDLSSSLTLIDKPSFSSQMMPGLKDTNLTDGLMTSLNTLLDNFQLMEPHALVGKGKLSFPGFFSLDDGQTAFASPGCYRDPSFDNKKTVPAEPASVSAETIQPNYAVPEPFSLLLLTGGAVLFLRKQPDRNR